MVRKRSAPPAGREASSELGTGDYAINFHTITGRAIRSCRTRISQPAQESQESFDDDGYDDMSDEIVVAPSRKKKQKTKRAKSTSPMRELPSDVDLEEAGMSDDDDPEGQHGSPLQNSAMLAGNLTVNLTVNIPLNHEGIITLRLDPKEFTPVPSKLGELSVHARSQPKSKRIGFLDLPAELKNDIYRQVLVGKEVSFGTPGNSFGRTSALLRTCRQVYVWSSLLPLTLAALSPAHD